jgi:putative FmdB family regulatory protein
MPIYEFYCRQCHTIYNFFSRTVNTDTIPNCPRCQTVKLQRKVSLFAPLSGTHDNPDEANDDLPPFDEAKMERAMGTLAREAEHLDEDNPRQAANLMRKLSDMTGLQMGSAMQEALSRMESGEDPEQIEAEMGDALENEEPFLLGSKSGKSGTAPLSPPNVDDTLYEL